MTEKVRIEVFHKRKKCPAQPIASGSTLSSIWSSSSEAESLSGRGGGSLRLFITVINGKFTYTLSLEGFSVGALSCCFSALTEFETMLAVVNGGGG